MVGTDLLAAANDCVHFFPFDLSSQRENLQGCFCCTVAVVFRLKWPSFELLLTYSNLYIRIIFSSTRVCLWLTICCCALLYKTKQSWRTFFVLPCFKFFYLLPNTIVTLLQQAHNSCVAVMLCHSEYACAFIFLSLFFLILSIYMQIPICLKSPIVTCFCCTTLSKAVSQDETSSTHPPDTRKLFIFSLLLSKPKLSQIWCLDPKKKKKARLGVKKK